MVSGEMMIFTKRIYENPSGENEFRRAGEKVTLLYGASDEEHNNAVALREYLMMRH